MEKRNTLCIFGYFRAILSRHSSGQCLRMPPPRRMCGYVLSAKKRPLGGNKELRGAIQRNRGAESSEPDLSPSVLPKRWHR